MGILFGAAWINPWLGLLSLDMVMICWYLSGWAFRLSVMGFVFTTDFLPWRKSGNVDTTGEIPAFITATAGKRWKLPARQYGRLRRGTEGTLYFVWRSWLVGPKREVDLGKPSDYQGGLTLLYPVILEGMGDNVLFRMPPRYRNDIQAIASALGLCGWRDVSLVRNMWSCVRQVFKGCPAGTPVT